MYSDCILTKQGARRMNKPIEISDHAAQRWCERFPGYGISIREGFAKSRRMHKNAINKRRLKRIGNRDFYSNYDCQCIFVVAHSVDCMLIVTVLPLVSRRIL